MKAFNLIAILVSVAAVAISVFVLRSTQIAFDGPTTPARGSDAKNLAIEWMSKPRWDGTADFFKKHVGEMIAKIEVANVLETDGVGLAFLRTSSGSDKKFQFCLWMRKTQSGWEHVPYLSDNLLSGNPFLGSWIQKNQDWLHEMESKKDEWEKQSQSVW